MRDRDTARFAAPAKLLALDRLIIELQAEEAKFQLRVLGPFDHSAGKFLAGEAELAEMKRRGHRVAWELRDGLNLAEVEAEWADLQRKLDAAREEQKVLQQIQCEVLA